MRFTSAVLALQAIVNCKTPVSSPHPSSMTPLQLSSIALKHISGPVGVHACRSVAPTGATRFAVTTSLAGDFAVGRVPARKRDESQQGREAEGSRGQNHARIHTRHQSTEQLTDRGFQFAHRARDDHT